MMNRATAVEPRSGWSIWICFEDGSAGEVDLSRHAGRGVFKGWEDRSLFEEVSIGPGGGPSWPGDLELCPDSVYLQLTGKQLEDVFPRLRGKSIHA